MISTPGCNLMDSAMITTGQVEEAIRLTLGRKNQPKNLLQIESNHGGYETLFNNAGSKTDQDFHFDQN